MVPLPATQERSTDNLASPGGANEPSARYARSTGSHPPYSPKQKEPSLTVLFVLAERQGFEPWSPFRS
jgi:hypothetical protein